MHFKNFGFMFSKRNKLLFALILKSVSIQKQIPKKFIQKMKILANGRGAARILKRLINI